MKVEGFVGMVPFLIRLLADPCTLAKGDDSCDFNFYRKGTARPRST